MCISFVVANAKLKQFRPDKGLYNPIIHLGVLVPKLANLQHNITINVKPLLYLNVFCPQAQQFDCCGSNEASRSPSIHEECNGSNQCAIYFRAHGQNKHRALLRAMKGKKFWRKWFHVLSFICVWLGDIPVLKQDGKWHIFRRQDNHREIGKFVAHESNKCGADGRFLD